MLVDGSAGTNNTVGITYTMIDNGVQKQKLPRING